MVFHVVSHWDNKEYVMKKISLKHLNEKKQKEALKEVSLMKSLSSPHIIQYALLSHPDSRQVHLELH